IVHNAVNCRFADVGWKRHYRRSADLSCMMSKLHRRLGARRRDIGHDRYTTRGLVDGACHHLPPFGVGKDHEFTGECWNDEAVDAATDAKVDLSPERFVVYLVK